MSFLSRSPDTPTFSFPLPLSLMQFVPSSPPTLLGPALVGRDLEHTHVLTQPLESPLSQYVLSSEKSHLQGWVKAMQLAAHVLDGKPLCPQTYWLGHHLRVCKHSIHCVGIQVNAFGPPHHGMCPCNHPQGPSCVLCPSPLHPAGPHSVLLRQQPIPGQHTMRMYTLVFSALWARGVIVNPAVDDTFIPPAAGGVNLWLNFQAGTPLGQTHLQAIPLGFHGALKVVRRGSGTHSRSDLAQKQKFGGV